MLEHHFEGHVRTDQHWMPHSAVTFSAEATRTEKIIDSDQLLKLQFALEPLLCENQKLRDSLLGMVIAYRGPLRWSRTKAFGRAEHDWFRETCTADRNAQRFADVSLLL